MPSRYPSNWEEIALAVKREAGWRCECCGFQCLGPGSDRSGMTEREMRQRTLSVHHWNLTPEDNRRENLVALCPACHLEVHRGGRGNISPGQLALWE